jgi:hypothetical protein
MTTDKHDFDDDRGPIVIGLSFAALAGALWAGVVMFAIMEWGGGYANDRLARCRIFLVGGCSANSRIVHRRNG